MLQQLTAMTDHCFH